MAVDVVYETHSLTEDNEQGIATGWLDGRLSPRGRRLAAELGQRRSHDGIVRVFTSDLARAVETTEIAFAGSPIPIVKDPRLRECNYGDLNGMPVTRLEAERLGHIDMAYPGGESYRQVCVRMAAFLVELARDRDGERVLLIGHAANRWALDHLLSGIPLKELVAAPFGWREGWTYVLPSGWRPGEE